MKFLTDDQLTTLDLAMTLLESGFRMRTQRISSALFNLQLRLGTELQDIAHDTIKQENKSPEIIFCSRSEEWVDPWQYNNTKSIKICINILIKNIYISFWHFCPFHSLAVSEWIANTDACFQSKRNNCFEREHRGCFTNSAVKHKLAGFALLYWLWL